MSSTNEIKVKRGDVKAYRNWLDSHGAGSQWKGDSNRGQKVRGYGSYLYSADRDMFENGMREWIGEGRPN